MLMKKFLIVMIPLMFSPLAHSTGIFESDIHTCVEETILIENLALTAVHTKDKATWDKNIQSQLDVMKNSEEESWLKTNAEYSMESKENY